MKRATSLLMASVLAGCIASCSSEKRMPRHRIVTNPINLNYRFQPKDESRREAGRTRGGAPPIRSWNTLKDITICLLPSPEVTGVLKI